MKIQRTPVIEIGKGEETTANKLSGEESLLERERDILLWYHISKNSHSY